MARVATAANATNVFLMGITFLIESDCKNAAFQGQSSIFHLNDQ